MLGQAEHPDKTMQTQASHANSSQIFSATPTQQIDQNLVLVMQKIEIKTRKALEKYAELKEIYGKDKRFMEKLRAKHKEIEAVRKDHRMMIGKERELKAIEERQ